MRNFLMTILLCCFLGAVQSSAEDTHIQLSGVAVGYINSSSSADPLTESMANFGYSGNIAFPYSYRCIGVERTGDDASREVNCMTIYLEKLNTGSSETGEEIPGDLEVYTSSDNASYTLLSSDSYITSCETLGSGGLVITLDGLSITQPYIKFRCVRTLSSYVFGSTGFQQMITLYTLNDKLFGDSQVFFTASNGYINSSSTADPLTESMANFGYSGNIAFPYSYRCIGVKKDDFAASGEVTRILISLNKVTPSSPETGDEFIDDLELYASSDNLNYRLIPGNYAKYVGHVAGGLKIALDGLNLKEQYIKLRCPRLTSGYVFAAPLQQLVKAVQATERRQIFSLVGFEDSFPQTNPLTESISMFGSTTSIAFPYGYRSIGLKKDDSEDGLNVHRLVLNLTKLVTTSTETGEEIVDDLNLYVSNDNQTYSLVPKTYSLYADILDDGIKITIDGLDISQKYIKVRCPRTATYYVFGSSNLQSMLTASRHTPSYMEVIDLPRFAYGSTAFKVSVTARQNETLKASYVPSTGTPQNLWTLTVPSDGSAVHSDSMELQSLPSGKIKLRFEVFDENNILIDRKDAYVFNTTGLVSSNLSTDNVSVIIPQASNLTGTWGDLSMTTGIDRNLDYKQAQSSDATCTVTLPDAGWCAVYVGLVGGDSRAVVSGLDATPQTLKLEYWRTDIPPATNAAGDTFVGCYDLTGGKTMTIARSSGTTPLQITHIAVHKLSQYKTNIATQSSSNAPRIIFHNDGYSGFFAGTYTSETALQNAVGAFNNVPIYSFDWCLGTTTVFNINTRLGISFGTSDPTLYYRDGDRLAGTLVQNLLANNINPLSVICDKGDTQNTTTNVTLRMGAFYAPPLSYSHNGPILNDNNNYRQRNVDGTTYAWKLSYAYPEVRNYVIETLRDALDSNVDGVHLQFLRHPPFFGYDQPLINEYISRHGSFSASCYMDANWQQIQQDIMTDLVEDIYQMIQSEAPVGKTIKLKASFDQQNYYRQGLDVAAWINAGWVDVISPGCYGVSAQIFDLSPFVAMVNGTSCKIFVHAESTIMGKDPTPEEENGEIEVVRVNMSLNQFRKYFMDMYEQGADGLYPFNYSAVALPLAVEDMKDNEIWRNFAEPFIDWLN